MHRFSVMLYGSIFTGLIHERKEIEMSKRFLDLMYQIQNCREIRNQNLIHAVNQFNIMDFSFQIFLDK